MLPSTHQLEKESKGNGGQSRDRNKGSEGIIRRHGY